MKDQFGRKIDYMRISITDRCNLRCRYCMPDGVAWMPMEEILTYEEIVGICRQAVNMGIGKFKLTGGEPLVRKGCPDLVSQLKKIPGVEQVTMTTNGVLLKDHLESLMEAGLDAVNISLDTLKPKRFQEITGFNKLDQVRFSIQKAVERGLPVKVNVVLQSGVNDDEWIPLMNLAKDTKLDVRFIEMMPIGHGNPAQMISNSKLLDEIRGTFLHVEADKRYHGNGPAVYYRIPGYQGAVGFISAMHGKFCGGCNRIRMTSTGELKPCLCYHDSVSVRSAVRKGDMEEVRRVLGKAVAMKPQMHCFEEADAVTERREMVKIGG